MLAKPVSSGTTLGNFGCQHALKHLFSQTVLEDKSHFLKLEKSAIRVLRIICLEFRMRQITKLNRKTHNE